MPKAKPKLVAPAPKIGSVSVDDEICQCGHSKGWHKAHKLDPHGSGCEKCDCQLYCWSAFVAYRRL